MVRGVQGVHLILTGQGHQGDQQCLSVLEDHLDLVKREMQIY